ncbi:hypothetical protein ACH4NF_03265 [Streptomyces sp. NPDC017248]|uniref:hypothetical protein n=1 Tax=unclassified Streptomyces TaxID=2593676 RepID=UPI0037975895
MTVQEPGSGAQEQPVPRDMPDQQAGPDEDPWDLSPGRPAGEKPDKETTPGPDEDAAPGPDGSGTDAQDAPRTDTEAPGPDEPSA